MGQINHISSRRTRRGNAAAHRSADPCPPEPSPCREPRVSAPSRPPSTPTPRSGCCARPPRGADDGELFLERRRSESLVFDDGRLRNAGYDAAEGFGLRAVRGETAGYAHSTEISEAALRRAAETARLAVGAGGGTLAAAPKPTNQRLYTDRDPFDDAEFAVKVEMLREIDAFLRGLDPRVVQVSASLGASMQEVEILRPEGTRLAEARPMVRLNISVIVEENGRRESGSAGGGGRHGLAPLMGTDHWQDVAREALRIAAVNLRCRARARRRHGRGARPRLARHPAARGDRPRPRGRLQPQADLGLRRPDGHPHRRPRRHRGRRRHHPRPPRLDLLRRRGHALSQRNVLIEDGILVGYMQDRQNARLMGVAPTGNGRRESYAHAPMPRMTNTYMLGGDAAPADVLAELKDGIYAVGFGGGQVDITNGKFVFSCTEAYRVKDGKVGAPVKGATLIGDGATALKQIRAIGNDMALDPGMGNCGKAGQWVPVGVGQPTVLIGGLTVGGSAA